MSFNFLFSLTKALMFKFPLLSVRLKSPLNA
nr:MAG TPA: hypothetical protein [Caudoviricetes sp.]DAQ53021.1 MAG TPA: hypothetical protein [Caudoviricetes sp.]DAX58449.1 MAG TPA: hypothetical protein [Caudoviricetes sp.]